MKNIKIILIGLIVLTLLIVMIGPFYILQEGDLAVRARFGKIISVENEAGLRFKMPLVDTILIYPKRIQPWDGDAQRVPTAENQFIIVDTTARWRISDAKLFYENLKELPRAHQRLDQIIDSKVRDVVANNKLIESVRNSNIINTIERENAFLDSSDTDMEVETTDIEEISTLTQMAFPQILSGRDLLSKRMLELSQPELSNMGIELIDLIVRQVKYSEDLTQSVYSRMIKERNQIAQFFRSQGEGAKANWLGKMERELRTVNSDAERKAKEIKAKADAEALDIRNRSYSKDPEFADFWMALVQYQHLLPDMKKILTTDFDFFKYLYSPSGK
jgi:membrane protease subunit HflC